MLSLKPTRIAVESFTNRIRCIRRESTIDCGQTDGRRDFMQRNVIRRQTLYCCYLCHIRAETVKTTLRSDPFAGHL